jgi:hypothetical protein
MDRDLARSPSSIVKLACLAVALGGCSQNSPGSPGGGATQGVGGSGTGGTSNSGGSAAMVSDALPARIRRLSNAEYDASVRALLGTASSPSKDFSFPPDAKQGPSNSPAGAAFTVNDAQRVDPVLADKLDTAAQSLIAEARTNGKLAGFYPCADASAAGGEACAKTFIEGWGAKAYRRPLTADEQAGLLKAYHVGADGYDYVDGIAQVTRVLLQSPGFLYTTELGEPGAPASFVMTSNEVATALSYLLTSGPPDEPLLKVAADGSLATAEGRESEAKRLLDTPAGHERFVRVVREWLGIDDVARREKSQSIYPEFAKASQSMEKESRDFIEEVLSSSKPTLEELLTADWTIVDAPLAEVYGVTSAGEGQRTSLAGKHRAGILNQAAFLSVFATNNGSHPVFRGVALMRRIACQTVRDPGAQNIVVSFPAADPSKTTRARFETHTKDPGCAGCHTSIDNFGFALERFDGMGKWREKENGLDIDTKVTLATGSDLDGTYADSAELMHALANSESVKACLARQLFRSTAARSDGSINAAEDAFVETWKQLPADQQGRLRDVLLAFVKTPTFVQRRTP